MRASVGAARFSVRGLCLEDRALRTEHVLRRAMDEEYQALEDENIMLQSQLFQLHQQVTNLHQQVTNLEEKEEERKESYNKMRKRLCQKHQSI